MARIKFTALVQSIQGTIAGTTFQRNAYGFTVKSKPNMVRPTRIRQNLRKKVLADYSREWGSLTQTQRDEWISYAASFPIPSRLNPASDLNGYNYFCRYHNLVNQGGNSILLTNPGTTQASFSYTAGDLILDTGQLSYEGSMSVGSGTWRGFLYATTIIPPGQAFIQKTPRFITDASVSSSYFFDMTPAYESVFGYQPVVGDIIGLRVVFLRTDNAQMVEFSTVQNEVIL